jgi:hypothetical protein
MDTVEFTNAIDQISLGSGYNMVRLSVDMQLWIIEQVEQDENPVQAAVNLIDAAYANARNLDIGCRLDMSALLTMVLDECNDADSRVVLERAREIVDKSELPELRWHRIGCAIAMLHSAVKLEGVYRQRVASASFPLATPYIRFALDGLKAEFGKSLYSGDGKWYFAGTVADLIYERAVD